MTVYGRNRNTGKIDSLARSSSLTAVMLADSPLMLWEGYASGATDLTGNGRHATIGANIISGLSLGTTGVASYQFPGAQTSANSISIADANWQSPHAGMSGAMTWECMFRVTNLSAARKLWTKGTDASSYEFQSSVSTAGAINAGVWQTSGSDVVGATSSSGAVLVNTDYHFVATFDRAAQQMKVFLNGVQVAISTTFSGSSSNASASLQFGLRSDSYGPGYLAGFASHIAVYSNVLNAGQISAHALQALA